jgi:hypothetical protein
LRYDLNGDAAVTTDDLDIVRAGYGMVLAYTNATADVNADGFVNDLDLYLVWQNLLKPAASHDLRYDLTGDGAVTLDDVAVIRANYRLDLSTTLRSYRFSVQHTYLRAGPFTATVTVFDSDGWRTIRTIVVNPNAGFSAAGVYQSPVASIPAPQAASDNSDTPPAGQDSAPGDGRTPNALSSSSTTIAIYHDVRAGSLDFSESDAGRTFFHRTLRSARFGGHFDRSTADDFRSALSAESGDMDGLLFKSHTRQNRGVPGLVLNQFRGNSGAN